MITGVDFSFAVAFFLSVPVVPPVVPVHYSCTLTNVSIAKRRYGITRFGNTVQRVPFDGRDFLTRDGSEGKVVERRDKYNTPGFCHCRH
jgi:hypothetical protein